MNSKKIIGIAIGVFVIAAAAATVISSRGRAKGKFVDGEWPGMGEGRNGPIELTLSVKGGKITGAKVTKESETGFAQPAEQFVIDQAVAKQSVEGLDIMSGATITSNATMAALQAAVKASKGGCGKSDGHVVRYRRYRCRRRGTYRCNGGGASRRESYRP